MKSKTTNKTMPSDKKGVCYLVGAGPGDPGLLTLRGRDCLALADVVVYDYLANPEFLNYAPENAEKIYVGKKAGAHTLKQEQINQLLIDHTALGKTVVRLKGGDPFVFGRGGEESEALAAAGLKFEIVPGISSAIAAPAYAGIPVTHRQHNAALTIFTGHEEPEKDGSGIDYDAIARMPGTKVMLMGIERLEVISQELIQRGMHVDTPVALVRWATTGKQKTITGTLDNIARLAKEVEFRPPAVVVIGEVVRLREELNWFEKRPLYGKRIAITRTRKQAGELVQTLRDLGADAFELPTIRIEPAPNRKEFYEVVADAHMYDWIVFTSPNGVDAFFNAFFEIYRDARDLGPARIATIGPATAARVAHFRFQVDLQPETYIAEAVVQALTKETSVENTKILLVHAEKARDVIAQELTRQGAIVDEGIAYRTVAETEDVAGGIKRFREEGADMVTFTSSSTVENFLNLQLPWSDNVIAASIGPITSTTLRENNIRPTIEAKQHDIPGLVSAIVNYWQDKK